MVKEEPEADPSLIDLLCLTMVPGVGPLTSKALLEYFKEPGRVLSASTAELKRVSGIGSKLAERIAKARSEYDPLVELERCRHHNVSLLRLDDHGYPTSIKEIHDPPRLLYIRGGLIPDDAMAVAVVGSRKVTPYGVRITERLAGSLARAGFTVVSGLARGIDAIAHRAAMKAGGRTIAVVANGLSTIYPPEHEKLADQVAEQGAVISEVPMEQEPLAGLFPQRNRLVSGFSLGVLVVEATARSGALSTAGHAVEQNREVFAVPGPIDQINSQGCHALIRDGARLVQSVDDILEELGPIARALYPSVQPAPSATAPAPPLAGPAVGSLSHDERLVFDVLDDHPKSTDDLVRTTGLAPQQVMTVVMTLQMKRLSRQGPGGGFTRY